MAQKRLALAYRETTKDGRPHVIYCGHDADACEREIEGALTGGVFLRTERYLLNAPVVKHANVSTGSPIPQPEPAPAKEKKKAKKAATKKAATKKAATKKAATKKAATKEEATEKEATEKEATEKEASEKEDSAAGQI